MGIQSWLSLWFGLALPAIVLMYMFKRKYVDTTVPSHLLWDRVLRNLEANRPWQKLQNRLLLWLQLLAAALLIFALMQPFLRVSGNGSQHIVIVADTSGSMSAKVKPLGGVTNQKEEQNSSSRMDLLKDRMKEYVKDQGKSKDITLLTVGARPVTLLSREGDKDKFLKAVDEMQPYYGQASYREALSLASALTREESDVEVVVFTDGQWKEDATQTVFNVPVSVEKITGGTPLNFAIEQFGISNKDTAGGSNTAVAVISSNSAQPMPVEVGLYGDDKLLTSREIEVQSGAKATISFADVPFAEVYRLELAGEDGYTADNETYAFGMKHGTSRVLLLTPGNLFLEKALQLSGAEVTRVTVNNSGDSDSTNSKEKGAEDQSNAVPVPEGNYNLIVMDGPMPEAYRQGEWSTLIAKTPLWTIGTQGKKMANPGGRPVMVSHPVTSYVSLSGVYIGTLLDENPAWGEPVIKFGDTPLVYAGKEGGHPRLSFGFLLQDSDLPLSSEFPVLVNNALKWMTSGKGSGLGRYMAGATSDIPVAADTVKAAWVPKGGLALKSGFQPSEAIRTEKGYSPAQTVPEIPGLYAFEQENKAGEKVSHWLAVTSDPFEGDWSADKGPGVSRTAAGQPDGEKDSEAASATEDVGASAAQLMPWLAALALAVIAAEWGVYQRGRSI
ncbi:VWA domain-containing protein [Paenibacillus sp. N3/727]|uniref:vWA domain-containing protein n=1 Tax=Paenibacillus sp. N3/727 TaxID=2925845 RepID=UPI001F5316B6|nr:VWA domain-containing protein [Paenibacillus sp. N3/727]UNK17518.1 VWA domain-containing protein [Paenibacillus sp. N3/727]